MTLAAVIAAGLVALLVYLNRQYLFDTLLYEHGDQGANSLSVLRAERFQEIYGAYSRWDLHHPGPALFYLCGWSEQLFYQWLHLVPTPYAAQVLACAILGSSLFAGAVCVAARWVRSGFFLPLTLLLGALHYSSVDPRFCLLSTWPPFTMPMIFLALVVAAASVGAGQGDDLALLVLAGGFAVHSHLAQPLFVVPLATLGYLGLSVNCFRVARAAKEKTVSAAPWRQFPRAHLFAALILFAFLLPLLADLCKGSGSNICRIIENLPSDPSKHHPWLACVYYLLRVGTYHPSIPGAEYNFAGHATIAEIGHYCATHLRMTVLWLGALVSPLLALVLRAVWKPVATVPLGESSRTADAGAVSGTAPAQTVRWRWRFLRWLLVCWIVAFSLTLYWAHIIEIEMAYYHIWFSYSLWFVLAMISAAALSDMLEISASSSGKPRLWVSAIALLCIIGVAWTVAHKQAQFRAKDFADEVSITQGKVIQAALAAQAGGSRTKILSFPDLAGGAASGMATLLDRLGYDARVDPKWLFEFGSDHAPPDLLEGLTCGPDGRVPFDIWRIVPAAANPEAAASRALADGYALVLTQPMLDPNPGFDLTFAGDHPNYDDFIVAGWTMRVTGSDFVWSEGKLGLVCFRPVPVPAGKSVELVFDCIPFLGKGRDVQRVNVDINDYELGTLRVDGNPNPAARRLLISGDVWNRLPIGLLILRFPDAISPEELGQNDDPRLLALATHKITFRLVDTPAMP